jgi:hypothetical protein
MEGVLSVNSQCQWAAIGDPWLEQPSDPMNRPPLSWMRSVGNTMNNIFNIWNEVYTHAKWVFVDLPICLADCAKHLFMDCHCDEPPAADFGCHP